MACEAEPGIPARESSDSRRPHRNDRSERNGHRTSSDHHHDRERYSDRRSSTGNRKSSSIKEDHHDRRSSTKERSERYRRDDEYSDRYRKSHRDSHSDHRRHRPYHENEKNKESDRRYRSSRSPSTSQTKKPKIEETTDDGDWVIAEDTGNFYSSNVQDFDKSIDPSDNNQNNSQSERKSSSQTPKIEEDEGIPSQSPDDGEVSDLTEPNQLPPSEISGATLPTINDLNKLKASILKAELQGNTAKAEDLKLEYDELAKRVMSSEDAATKSNGPAIDSRFSIHQPKSENPSDPTIQDMLREELNTRHEKLDLKMAEQISKDGGYINDLDYISDNADKLAEVSQKSDKNLKNQMIENTRKLHQSISDCRLCLEDGGSSGATVIAIGTQVYLCVAPEPAIVKGALAIIPMDHYTNTLECNDDEWEEIRNFMKCITQMWYKKRKGVIFYENAVNRSGRLHAAIFAVPVPFHLLDSAPGFFQESIIASDEEWSSHRHIIDTRKATDATQDIDVKYLFRTSIAKEAPYFHAWFNINGGIGHIVENASRWPKGDRFARDVIGGMLQADPVLIRQSSRWTKNAADRDFIDNLWRDFDWTVDIPR